MILLLAVATGMVLGYLLERGDFCFHSALRGIVHLPKELTLFRAYLLVLLLAVPLVQGMIALGWIAPWVPPFAWRANIAGGLVFGVGMVVGSTCVTGLFYKLGHGMLGTLVGLAAWAAGDILTYRGPLTRLRDLLNAGAISVDGRPATLLNLAGPAIGGIVLIALGAGAALVLWRSDVRPRPPLWDWRLLGIAVGIFTSVAWLLALAGSADYTFGTSGVPTTLYAYVVEGAAFSPWIPVTLLSIIPGALVAALVGKTLWIRGESGVRYLGLAAGGFLMGTGAAISGGCNLGHSLVGVPLLSLGSIATTMSMLVGVWIADRMAATWMRNRS